MEDDVIYQTRLDGDKYYVVSVDTYDELEIGTIDGNSGATSWIMYLNREEALGMARAIMDHYSPPLITIDGALTNDIIQKIKETMKGSGVIVLDK